MPEALWDEALALAGQVGVYQAAAVLGLSYSTLKRRFDAEVQGPELTAEVPAFVEWLAPAVGGSCQGTPTFPHLGDTHFPAGH
jgi:hypothetical protein